MAGTSIVADQKKAVHSLRHNPFAINFP